MKLPRDGGSVSGPGAFVALTRPGNAAMTGAAVLLGAYAAGGVPGFDPVWRPLLLALTGTLFAAGANALNDAGDAEVDRRAHPERPVPSGRVTARQARAAGLALLALAFVPTALAAPAGLLVVAIAAVAELAYEWRLKAAGLPGNVAVALLTAAPFLLGAVGAGRLPPEVVVFAALAALATLGRELLKDVEDAPHDVGRRTLAQRDRRFALALGAGALVAAVALSPVPFLLTETVLGGAYLAAVAPADALFLAAAMRARSDVSRAQRLAKLGMLVALVALAVGRWHGDL